jgi:hypothetical protein
MTPSDDDDETGYEPGFGGSWMDADNWGPDDFIPLTADDFIYGLNGGFW